MTQLTFTQSEFEEFKVFLENASPGAASRGLAWGQSYQVHHAMGLGDPRRWLENGGQEAVAAYDAFKAYRRLAGPINIRRSLQKLDDLAGGGLTPVDVMETIGIPRKRAEQIDLNEYTGYNPKAAQKALAEQASQEAPPAGDEPPADNEPGEDTPGLNSAMRAKFADLVSQARILLQDDELRGGKRLGFSAWSPAERAKKEWDRFTGEWENIKHRPAEIVAEVSLMLLDPDLPIDSVNISDSDLVLIVKGLQAMVDNSSEDKNE
jgi:hypothetical protein